MTHNANRLRSNLPSTLSATAASPSFNTSWDDAIHTFCLEFNGDSDTEAGSVSSYSNSVSNGPPTSSAGRAHDQSLDRYHFASQKHMYKFGYQSDDEAQSERSEDEFGAKTFFGKVGGVETARRSSLLTHHTSKSTGVSTASSDQEDDTQPRQHPQTTLDESIDDLMRYLAENINDSEFSNNSGEETEKHSNEHTTEVVYTDNTPENSAQSQSQKTTQELLRLACTQKYVTRPTRPKRPRKVLKKKRSPVTQKLRYVTKSPDTSLECLEKTESGEEFVLKSPTVNVSSAESVKISPVKRPARQTRSSLQNESKVGFGQKVSELFESTSSDITTVTSKRTCAREFRSNKVGGKVNKHDLGRLKKINIESSSDSDSSDCLVVTRATREFRSPEKRARHEGGERLGRRRLSKSSCTSTPARGAGFGRDSESDGNGEHVGFDDSELISQDMSMHKSDEEFLDDFTQAVTATQMQRYTGSGQQTQCAVELFNNKRSVQGYNKDIDTSDDEDKSPHEPDEYEMSFINDATILDGNVTTEISPLPLMTQGPIKTRRQRYLRNQYQCTTESPRMTRKTSIKRKRVVKFAESSDDEQ